MIEQYVLGLHCEACGHVSLAPFGLTEASCVCPVCGAALDALAVWDTTTTRYPPWWEWDATALTGWRFAYDSA
jgi:hypothetical protein